MQASSTDDGYDWPYILYIGRKWLGYTDEQTLALTPRQFAAQLRVHVELMQGHTDNSQAGFIDQIPGW